MRKRAAAEHGVLEARVVEWSRTSWQEKCLKRKVEKQIVFSGISTKHDRSVPVHRSNTPGRAVAEQFSAVHPSNIPGRAVPGYQKAKIECKRK